MNFLNLNETANYFLKNKDRYYYFVIIVATFILYKDAKHFYESIVIGSLILLIGELLRFWALTYSIKLERNKLPMDFVSIGPYAYLRNPKYLANILIIFSLCFMLGARWFALLASLFLFIIYNLISKLEEENLLKLKGKEYYRYKNSVKRWLPSFYIKISHDQEKFYFWEAIDKEKRLLKYYLIILAISIAKQFILNLINKF